MFPNLDVLWVFQLQATTSPPVHAPLMSLTQQGSQVFLSPSPFHGKPNILSLLPHPSLRQDTKFIVHTATSLSLTHTALHTHLPLQDSILAPGLPHSPLSQIPPGITLCAFSWDSMS